MKYDIIEKYIYDIKYYTVIQYLPINFHLYIINDVKTFENKQEAKKYILKLEKLKAFI